MIRYAGSKRAAAAATAAIVLEDLPLRVVNEGRGRFRIVPTARVAEVVTNVSALMRMWARAPELDPANNDVKPPKGIDVKIARRRR